MSNKSMKPRKSGSAVWSVSGPEYRDLKKILIYLDNMDLPYLESALRNAGEMVAEEARKRNPAAIADRIRFDQVKGIGVGMKAIVKGDHPGTKTYEFGRRYYYRRATELATTSNRGKKRWFGAYIGNNRDGFERKKGSMKGQQHFASKGFYPPRPIIGVLATSKDAAWSSYPGALQVVGPKIDKMIRQAIADEFDRKVQELGA